MDFDRLSLLSYRPPPRALECPFPHRFRSHLRTRRRRRADHRVGYPPYRASLTTLYNSLWYSGPTIAARSTFGASKINSSWTWRIPSAIQAVPSILQLGLLWLCSESPRWFVSKGRDTEALRVLAYYHAMATNRIPSFDTSTKKSRPQSISTGASHPPFIGRSCSGPPVTVSV